MTRHRCRHTESRQHASLLGLRTYPKEMVSKIRNPTISVQSLLRKFTAFPPFSRCEEYHRCRRFSLGTRRRSTAILTLHGTPSSESRIFCNGLHALADRSSGTRRSSTRLLLQIYRILWGHPYSHRMRGQHLCRIGMFVESTPWKTFRNGTRP